MSLLRFIFVFFIYIHNTAVLIKICRFLINVVKIFTQTLTKLDLPTLRKGSIIIIIIIMVIFKCYFSGELIALS